MQFFLEIRVFVVFHVTKIEPDHFSFGCELLIILFWSAAGIVEKNCCINATFLICE